MPDTWSISRSSPTRCAWRAAHRHCTTASRGVGWLTALSSSCSSILTGSCTPPTVRAGRRSSAAAPCLTTSQWRWRPHGGRRTANGDRLPNPNNRDHLASIDFSPMEFVTAAHRRRANAILLRRTDRLPFASPPNREFVERVLRTLVDDEALRLDVIADDARSWRKPRN